MYVEINGAAATPDELILANASYGHFTSMQVRNGAVTGLGLHLQRLVDATHALFGSDLDAGLLRQQLRQALHRAGGEASVRVVVYSRHFDRERPESVVAPDTLVAVSPPTPPRSAPIRVQLREYARELPQIKHLATFGPFWQRREARLAGYDDALFCTAAGDISEGTFWNIGFWDGQRVIWPQAPMLDGVSQRVLDAGLAAQGTPSAKRRIQRSDLPVFTAAFACNATGAATPIAAIDGHPFQTPPALIDELLQAYRCVAAEPV